MWNDLNMSERAEVIKMATKQGITDLHTIRNTYNKYADGGFIRWKNEILRHKGIKVDEDNTYDYEGYFNDNPEKAWRMLEKDAKEHFPDTYKTPNHPTYSDESRYSMPPNIEGGHWYDKPFDYQRWDYQLSPTQIASDWNVDRTLDYAADAEDEGFRVIDSKGKLPIINNTVIGGVLPSVDITPAKNGITFAYGFKDGGIISATSNKKGGGGL